MDYSLIVGVDKSSTELVVGIVGRRTVSLISGAVAHTLTTCPCSDFLRPYTWDKRLETWVKETAYIGGGPREPTVLNPRIYKNRFREAMSRCKGVKGSSKTEGLANQSYFQISFLCQIAGLPPKPLRLDSRCQCWALRRPQQRVKPRRIPQYWMNRSSLLVEHRVCIL